MDILGFNLLLQDFCEYCPEFEPEVEKMDHSGFMEPVKCYTNIRCAQRERCERIAVNIQKQVVVNAKD